MQRININAVPDGFLPGLPSGNDPPELVDSELFRICPGDVMPAVDADQFDRVDHRVPLESFQCIDQDRLVTHIAATIPLTILFLIKNTSFHHISDNDNMSSKGILVSTI